MINVVYLAGGVGARTKLGYPKQVYLLEGKPVMVHALEVFQNISEVDKIIVASVESRIEEFEKYIKQYRISKAFCVPGGEARQKSVAKALQYCDSDRVIVHEAVRPFITKEHVQDLIKESESHLAVVPCLPIPFTVVNRKTFGQLNRDDLVNIQLPQVFKTELLKCAHTIGRNLECTDDSSLLIKTVNCYPYLVDGLEENIKITTPLDIVLAEAIHRRLTRGRD